MGVVDWGVLEDELYIEKMGREMHHRAAIYNTDNM